MPNPSLADCPLVVDLDGTLIHTDLLHESALRLLREAPWMTLALPVWLMRGKAHLKRRIAGEVQLDAASLPYNQELIVWLTEQKQSGRKLVLSTASDLKFAQAVADHLGLFEEIMASEGQTNLAGRNKADALVGRFSEKGFDYAGNSSVDLDVWRKARRAIVVNGSPKLAEQAGAVAEVEHVLGKPETGPKIWLKVLRLHQWIKNTLIFAPVFAAHLPLNRSLIQSLLLAFLSFGLCASTVYIANDLLDLESDRQHPSKRFRPFASGAVEIWKGVALAPFLLIASFVMAAQVGIGFMSWLMIYFILTCAYSFGLKRMVLVDCLTLAFLYTLRIVAGAAAVHVTLSFWLLALSIFLFLSLAFVKRYAELRVHEDRSVAKAHGRGYYTSDAGLVQQLGVGAGYAATLVLALYLNNENITLLYPHPEIIWAAVPLMLLWLSRMWLKAHRGLMHDDPIVFAVKDKASLLIGAMFVASFILAGFDWKP